MRRLTHTVTVLCKEFWCSLALRLTWASKCKRPLGRPLSLCFQAFNQRESTCERRDFGCESDVDAFGQPKGTFGAHRGALYKTLSHQQEPERWEVRGKVLLHQTEAKASPCNRFWKWCGPFKRKWMRREQTKNTSRLIWLRHKQRTKNCAFRMKNCAGICKTRQAHVRKEIENLRRHPGSFRCRSRKKSWMSWYRPRS